MSAQILDRNDAVAAQVRQFLAGKPKDWQIAQFATNLQNLCIEPRHWRVIAVVATAGHHRKLRDRVAFQRLDRLMLRPRYPKLSEAALAIANVAIEGINAAVLTAPDEGMPYKEQWILEEVIAILQEKV